jgi:hypothetical protein
MPLTKTEIVSYGIFRSHFTSASIWLERRAGAINQAKQHSDHKGIL